jgi:hypothetical protein
VVAGPGDRRQAEHHIRSSTAKDPAADLRDDQSRGVLGGDRAERALDQGYDWVERRRHRLQGQDQRGQYRTGGQAAFQQLQPGLAGRQPDRRDPGADYGRDQERGPGELGRRPPGQCARHPVPISEASAVSSPVRAR